MPPLRRVLLLAFVCSIPLAVRGAEPAPRMTHGPILGRLGAHEIGVWIRTGRPGAFRVRYGVSGGPLDQLSDTAGTSIAHDNAGWVHVTGLKSNTKYDYSILLVGNAGLQPAGTGGSFRTLPDPADFRDPQFNPDGRFNFRFEFACGNNQDPNSGSGPELPAFKTMMERLRDTINFAILNGDWLYEARREYTPQQWMRQVGVGAAGVPAVVRRMPSIAGVWENYKLYLSRGANLATWHRVMPSFFTFDDHEMLNDIWGAGDPGLVDRRAVFRDVGVRAWYDYLGWSNPVVHGQAIRFGQAQIEAGSDVLTDPDADFTTLDLRQAGTLHVHWGGVTAGVNDNALDDLPPVNRNAGVYGISEIIDKHRLRIHPAAKADGTPTYSIGRRSYYRMRVANCDFFLLDTRSHRQMHDTSQRDKPGLSMLGVQQKEWLMEGMKNSDAGVFFVVSSVNFMVPHVGGGAVRASNKDDAWTAFLDEREQLIRFWDSLGKPVMVLTGDLHNSFAIKITDRVREFASGPHNSQNHLVSDEGDRPANGVYDSFGRKCEIRWSSYYLNDIPRDTLRHPMYSVVQVNNVFNNPKVPGQDRWVAFPHPQVIFQYFDGRTGEMRYAETVTVGL